MAQATNAFRRRAGHLSALVKGFTAARDVMQNDGSIEEALEMVDKLNDIYKAYLESHELAMETNDSPSREQTLIDSFTRYERRCDQVLDELNEFIHDGTKPDPSVHNSIRASSRSSMRTANTTILSVNRSQTSSTSQARLSEARVQAELAKADVESLRKLQEAQQEKLQFEREEAQRRLKLDEETARRREVINNQIEMQRKVSEFEKLQTEVKIREREEMRLTLGSDYESSDEERDDVTQPKNTRRGFQDIEDQQAKMLSILQEYSKPHCAANGNSEPQRDVEKWLASKTPRDGYVSLSPSQRDVFEKSVPVNTTIAKSDASCSIQEQSDAALFSRALRDNRLPKPKILSFDGDPKQFKMFMASFQRQCCRDAR